MKSYIIFITLFLFGLSCQAQNGDANFREGIDYLNSGQYSPALEAFERAAILYQKIDDKIGYSKAILQATKIKVHNKKFALASVDIEALLDYYGNNQLGNDSLWVEIMNTKALNLKHLGEFKKALSVNDQLLKNERISRQYSYKIYHLRSRIEMDLGDYSKAINSAKKALAGYITEKDSLNQAAIYNIIGVGLYFQDKLDSTLVYYNKSLLLKKQLKADNYDLAISTFNIGIVYEDMADYENAIRYYKQAEKNDLLDGGETVGLLCDIYGAMVNTYATKEDFGNAEIYAKKALQLAKRVYGENSTFSSFVYVSYANLLELKDQRRDATRYIKKALEIRKKTYGTNHRWTFDSYLDLSKNYLQLKELDSAKINLQNALRVAKKLNSKVSLCAAKKVLGELHDLNGEHKKAQKLYQEVQVLSNVIYGENYARALEIRHLLTQSYFLNGDLAQAEKSIKWFKEAYTKKKGTLIEVFIPDILDLENKIYAQSKNLTSNKGVEEKVIANILTQINIIKKNRNRYSSIDSKLFAGNELDKVISYAIELCYKLYGKSKKDSYLETAFKISELNRNNILLEGIRKTQFKKIAGIPDSILNIENRLIQGLEQTKKELHYAEKKSEPLSETIDSLLSVQLILSTRLEEHLKELRRNYPKYFSLKYAQESITLDRLQNDILKQNQTFLEYYVGDTDTYVFVIEKASRKLLKISETKSLKATAIALRDKITERKALTQEARQLFKLLLGNLDVKKDLIIVADNFLNDIPFEILQNDLGPLIENHAISYVGSADLFEQQKQDSFEQENKFIWCGFAPEFESVYDLAYTKDEIAKIAKIMGGKMFLGEMATLENFKEQAGHSSILHLATHTILDNLNPKYNKLLFATNSLNNELTTSEIYTLSLNAKLAVLSACNTGYGTYQKGEGAMNMARAFKYAGVESTVMSLWRVPDKQTSAIMVSFYEYLKKGLPKNNALQKAKLDYLKNTDNTFFKHPFYWSGFIVSGNIDPIKMPVSTWWWVSGVAVLLLFGVWWLKKRKSI